MELFAKIKSIAGTYDVPNQQIDQYDRLPGVIYQQPGHGKQIFQAITRRSTSEPTFIESIWASVTKILGCKAFWLDVAIFMGILASLTLVLAMAKWAIDGVTRCESRARAFFWWLSLFIGGLVLTPTLVIAIPLLLANVFFELFHLVRGTKSPGFGWVITASTFCHHSWSIFCAKLFKPEKTARDAPRTDAPRDEEDGPFDDVPLENLPPYPSYQQPEAYKNVWV